MLKAQNQVVVRDKMPEQDFSSISIQQEVTISDFGIPNIPGEINSSRTVTISRIRSQLQYVKNPS